MKALVKIAGVALLALGLTSAAEAATRIGVLHCHVQAGEGLVVGSTHEVRCLFKADNGRHERYAGRINKIGLDVGATRSTHIVWAVFAPSQVSRHALAGEYLGAQASATLGVGGGANVLVGGNAGTVSLQPLSLQDETGVAIAAGVGELKLR